MDPRNILSNEKTRLLLDSISIDRTINDHYLNAIYPLTHFSNLELVRTPLETDNVELKKIPEIKYNYEKGEITSISTFLRSDIESRSFHFKRKDMIDICRFIYAKSEISENELNEILSVFVQANYNWYSKNNIFISTNPILLKNRLWFEHHVPGKILNIMTPEEAAHYIDLFFKYNKKYILSNGVSFNKSLWYWFSTRIKLPYYNVGDQLMDALVKRIYFSLIAIDEMGVQYYLGANNDTLDTTLYHFDYYISLITGVFDNLALKTNSYLSIDEIDYRKVSLTNDGFLKRIRLKNIKMRDLIAEYSNYIKLIYCFRELIIHRQGLENYPTRYHGDVKWEANMVKIDEEMLRRIDSMGNKSLDFDPFSVWGYYNIGSDMPSIEPLQFSKLSLTILLRFVNEYLQLFGYTSFIEQERKTTSDFALKINLFEKYSLGI